MCWFMVVFKDVAILKMNLFSLLSAISVLCITRPKRYVPGNSLISFVNGLLFDKL